MIKDREVAAHVLTLAFEASAKLNESIHIVLASESKDEVPEFKRAVGAVLAELLTEILNPIIREHPELAPQDWHHVG